VKPRIEKKLSKRLAAILVGQPRVIGRIWIDNEFERYVSLWRGDDKPPPTAGEVRRYYEAKVRVNHVPSIGGGLDYFGEGEDHFTVYQAYRDMMYWTAPETMDWMKADSYWMFANYSCGDGEAAPQGERPKLTVRKRFGRPTGADMIRHALELVKVKNASGCRV
jgi:hypothetical protein